ncbi:MAG: acyltransferase [Fimbriimonadaceae bacterium]|nr:acyltransferase [Fimbriimonadaceae bacterium]
MAQNPAFANAPAKARDTAFDVLKGIGITEVVLHHVLSHTARKYTDGQDDPQWWVLMMLNWGVHFGVPTFLLASTILLARSLISRAKPDWRRFYRRRAERTLYPYLVWWTLYVLFRIFVIRDPYDATLVPSGWPGIGQAPWILADPTSVVRSLLAGKGYFHLYFLIVLLQLGFLFPVFLAPFRRWRPSFALVLGGAFALQAGVYLLQRLVRFPWPGSSILWYVPAIALGLWIGTNWEEWVRNRRYTIPFALMAAILGPIYLVLEYRILAGLPIVTIAHSFCGTGYAVGVAGLLLRLSTWLVERRPGLAGLLGGVGDWSLPLFLIHPAVMYLLSGPKVGRAIMATGVPVLAVFTLVYLVTGAVAWTLIRSGMGPVLFGRTYRGRGV